MIDSFRGKYFCFSNFFEREVVLHGLTFPSNEHGFQAAKTDDVELKEWIRGAPDASEAKKRGRSEKVKAKMRPDWEAIKLSVMEELVRQKFTRYDDIRKVLLDTGDQELVEGNWWKDRIWGMVKQGGSWVGENNLGKILMKVRADFRTKEKENAAPVQ